MYKNFSPSQPPLFVLMALMYMLSNANFAVAQSLPRCAGANTDNWNQCIGTKKLNSETTYSGEFRNGIPNGFGEVIFANENNFKGEFKNGKFTGNGYLTLKPDNRGYGYIGELRNGEFHGRGKRFAGDLIYEGDFKNGKWDGRGTVIHDGGKYKY